MNNNVQKFNAIQIENIIDKVVPLIAKEEDYEFFRGMLNIVASESKSSAHFTAFIQKLLSN